MISARGGYPATNSGGGLTPAVRQFIKTAKCLAIEKPFDSEELIHFVRQTMASFD
jgi:hypothetical protein